MSDINEFVKNMGNDISGVIAPGVEKQVVKSGDQIANLAAPQVHDFVTKLVQAFAATATPMARDFSQKLVKDIFNQQSPVLRDFVIKVVQDLAGRYEPVLTGNVHTKIVNQGIQLTSNDTRLEIKERGTNKPVASLDLPVDFRIDLKEITFELDEARLDVKTLKQ